MELYEAKKTITFKVKELKGSRLRCLMLTSLSRDQVASALNQMVSPFGTVTPQVDQWKPEGFLNKTEAKLGESQELLPVETRETLTSWWLHTKGKGQPNTPNWDLASTCLIEDRKGLVLIEAKAHNTELSPKGKTKDENTNKDNHKQIGSAIQQSNEGLNGVLQGWSLSRDSHYQLSNRFAWAWKVASAGTPVILVYLGFLDATEMTDRRRLPFSSQDAWRDHIMTHAENVVPSGAWESRLEIKGTPLIPIIRSAEITVTAGKLL